MTRARTARYGTLVPRLRERTLVQWASPPAAGRAGAADAAGVSVAVLPFADLSDVQDAIAGEIMNALAVRLTGTARREGLFRGGTADLEAYDLYLLGRQKWATRQILLLLEAVEHFERAIARDSSFALAWSGLADAIDALAWRRVPGARARVDEAKYAAHRAILLDPQLAEAWASLGVLVLEFDRDWRFAELALRRAIELKPSYAMAHDWLADALLYIARPAESLVHRKLAREFDPVSVIGWMNEAWALAVAGRWDEARSLYLRLDLRPITNTATPLMGVTNARQLGFNADEAAMYAQEWARRAGFAAATEAAVIGRAVLHEGLRAEARALLRRVETEGVPPRELAALSVVFGDHEAAVRLLQRAFEDDDPQLILVGVEPTFDPLRADPRFIRILEALRLPIAHTPEVL
jgi:tetratricopeptide (TPR) repeat protein